MKLFSLFAVSLVVVLAVLSSWSCIPGTSARRRGAGNYGPAVPHSGAISASAKDSKRFNAGGGAKDSKSVKGGGAAGNAKRGKKKSRGVGLRQRFRQRNIRRKEQHKKQAAAGSNKN